MRFFNKFLKGHYKAYIICKNCGFNSEIRVPKGTSVADFVKGGKCSCDNCHVVGYPSEYTTEHFEKERKKELVLKEGIDIKPKSNSKQFQKSNKEKEMEDFKWKRGKGIGDIRWLS